MAAVSAEGNRDRRLRQQRQQKHAAVEVAMHAFLTHLVVPHSVEQPSTELHTWPVSTHISTRRPVCACSPMESASLPLRNEESSSNLQRPKMEGMVITHSTYALAQ